ncbi:hypothetical protein [Microbacterium sp.]|uniref:hypothetical protein n=1 Tax=Microbacterium sp. TaxID=51671 RepID=UPI003F729B09
MRNADGEEVVSSTQVTVALAEDIPIGSLVTVWPGGTRQREAKVIAIGHEDNGDTPLDSFQVLSLE